MNSLACWWILLFFPKLLTLFLNWRYFCKPNNRLVWLAAHHHINILLFCGLDHHRIVLLWHWPWITCDFCFLSFPSREIFYFIHQNFFFYLVFIVAHNLVLLDVVQTHIAIWNIRSVIWLLSNSSVFEMIVWVTIVMRVIVFIVRETNSSAIGVWCIESCVLKMVEPINFDLWRAWLMTQRIIPLTKNTILSMRWNWCHWSILKRCWSLVLQSLLYRRRFAYLFLCQLEWTQLKTNIIGRPD